MISCWILSMVLAAHLRGISAYMWGTRVYWSSTAWIILICEPLTVTLLLAVTFFIQSRKTDFLYRNQRNLGVVRGNGPLAMIPQPNPGTQKTALDQYPSGPDVSRSASRISSIDGRAPQRRRASLLVQLGRSNSIGIVAIVRKVGHQA